MLVAFLVLYKRSVKRTRKLMIYAVIIGFIGEYLFSIVLGMYTYRLSNLPFYIPLGHAVVYARTYCFSKASIVNKYQKEIEAGDHHDPTALELYCDSNPSEPECLVYDD